MSDLEVFKKKLDEMDATLKEIREALLLTCDGIDVITTQLRRNLAQQPFKPVKLPEKAESQTPKPITEPSLPPIQKDASPKLPFDPTKIKWQDKTNENGPYQLSEDYDNLDHKKLLKFLADAGGGLPSQGYWYWVFREGSKIGRRTLEEIRKHKKEK